jgi:hypothetical protein
MSAKDIIVKPISSQDAARIVKSCHYSGKVTQNSQLHFGVFLNGKCGGAMQFGPSIDKRKIQGLIKNTKWNDFLELNRMAFADWLPRNSESRAISIAMRLIKKSYPNIEWIISFADGTQCGDGTIYRASGFVLCGIKENKTMLMMPDGSIVADKTLNNSNYLLKGQSAGYWKKNGAKPLKGFQLRYIYFLNPEAKSRLTVPILPFTEIERRGAGMYRGKPKSAESIAVDAPCIQQGEGSASLTSALQSDDL